MVWAEGSHSVARSSGVRPEWARAMIWSRYSGGYAGQVLGTSDSLFGDKLPESGYLSTEPKQPQGIGLHTPFTAHIGTAHAIRHKRGETIEAFRAAHPQRFTRRPVLPGLPEAAWINEPQEQGAVEHCARHLQEVA